MNRATLRSIARQKAPKQGRSRRYMPGRYRTVEERSYDPAPKCHRMLGINRCGKEEKPGGGTHRLATGHSFQYGRVGGAR